VRQCLMIARVEVHPLLTAVPYVEERARIHGLDRSRLRHLALSETTLRNTRIQG
jgi:hypothetical protein